MAGQLVLETGYRTGDFEINTQGLTPCHYVVQFKVGEDTWVRKMTVKQKSLV